MKKGLLYTTLACFILCYSDVSAQKDQVLKETNSLKLFELAEQWRNEKIQSLEGGQYILVEQQRESRTVESNGTISQYQGLSDDGRLLFYITDNLDAARTVSTDKVWPGGGLGFTLTGGGIEVGEWDGGAVRTTHQEFTGRAFQLDSTSTFEDHPTHVAGTMIAAGVVSTAKGMAYAADLLAYDWDFDNSEMATAAANGMLISNHSYGSVTGWRYNSATTNWEWWGDTTLSGSQDYKFGQYNSQSQAWDQIARNAPYYLIVKSAGNDRGDGTTGAHYLPLHSAWSTTSRPVDGGASGYDCISTYSGAKNILTIGAVDAIPAGYSGPSSVVMSSFSGWGPTDDGRIKPDLVANGVGVYSSLATSNSAYASWNGTSMAAPNAAGSLVLVQQKYLNDNAAYMKAATLKALAIHTADEAGSGAGPDYSFGWGLLNTASAVQHIADTTGTKAIVETSVTNSNTYTFNISVNGFSPIKATICWTDLAGTPSSSLLNSNTPMLVNDLDIRIIRDSDSTIFYPYILNPASPSATATTGDNFRDNVEQIFMSAPAAGSYTVVVSHKGSLAGGSQDFSLILDGGIPPPQPLNCVSFITPPSSQNFDALSNCSGTAGASCVLPLPVGWYNDTNDDIDWTVDNGGTPNASTGPSIDFTTGTSIGKYLYTESSTNGTGYPGKQAILYSPCINLDTINNAELYFAYHMYGSTMGSLSVEVFNGFSWTQLWTQSGDKGDVWNVAFVDLSLYDGDTIQIRIVGTTGNGFLSDMAIDGLEIREALSCPGSYGSAVSNITDTTATISWNSAASFWKVRLEIKNGPVFIPNTMINFNPVLISGLLPNTTYEFYIQDSCSNGDTSTWFGPIEFTTTGPHPNPTTCGLSAVIPDDDCPNKVYLPIQVTSTGTQLGTDVFLSEVKVIIAHTYDADLEFWLASPGGDTILLSSGNGGSGNNFGNPLDLTCNQTTTFTMSASTSITAGTAPFIGDYIPEESLTNLHTGSNPNGIWKFIVCDNAGGDIGSLEYLELVFDSTTCAGPSNFAISNVTDSSAIFAWSSNASFWNISLKIKNGPVVIPPSSINFNPVLFSGLSSSTTYEIFLQDSCSNGDTSAWFGPFEFTTSGPSLNPTICGLNAAIPDDDCPNLVYLPVQVSTFGTQLGTDIILSQVKIIIEHTWDADLQFWVASPAGDTILLSAGNGGSGNNFGNPLDLTCSQTTTFTMSASTAISAGTAPFIGNYLPQESFSNLHTGSDPNGIWKFIVCDNASGDIGELEYFELVFDSIVCNPPQVSVLNNGTDDVCIGDTRTLSSSISGIGYQWYKNGSPVSGATSSTLVINDGGLYNVWVDSSAGCGDSAATGRNIIIRPLPVVSINNTGQSSFCFGGSALLMATSGASGYQWYKDGNLILGSTSASYTANATGKYNVILTSSFGCTDSASNGVNIIVHSLPVVNLMASSSTSFCQNDSVTLFTLTPGISYSWYRNGSLLTGPASLTYTASITGNYNVRVSDANNCSDSASSGIQVVVHPLPVVNIVNIGSTTFCDEDSVTLSATTGVSYQWYNSGNLIGGANNQSLTVKSAGDYNVVVTDNNTCSDSASISTTVTVNPLPAGTISFSSQEICEGDTSFLTVSSAFTSYNWILNGNPTGWTSNNTYPATLNGMYTVLIEDVLGCEDTAQNSVQIIVNDLPVVTLDPLDDVCNISPSFALSGGNPAGGIYSGTGVTSGQFDPGIAGPGTHDILYKYTDSKSCVDSAGQQILVKNCTGIDENGNSGKVSFYPNPTNGIINIEFDEEWEGEIFLQLFNAEGSLVLNQRIANVNHTPKVTIQLNELSDGIYFLHLVKGQEKWIQKVIFEKNF